MRRSDFSVAGVSALSTSGARKSAGRWYNRREMEHSNKLKRMVLGAGFTLVELLVVMAIIGLLASVVVVSTNVMRKKARDSRRIADLKQTQVAIELYYQYNGRYPPSCKGDGGTNGVNWGAEKVDAYGAPCPDNYIVGLAPTYLQALPRDPITGQSNCHLGWCGEYLYTTINNGQDYKLMAYRSMESTVVGRCSSACDTTTYPWCASDNVNTASVFSPGGACY